MNKLLEKLFGKSKSTVVNTEPNLLDSISDKHKSILESLEHSQSLMYMLRMCWQCRRDKMSEEEGKFLTWLTHAYAPETQGWTPHTGEYVWRFIGKENVNDTEQAYAMAQRIQGDFKKIKERA